MRIRDKWRSGKSRSLSDKATALAYIIWQIGLHYTKNLHQEEFDFESDEQRISVIQEYLIFLCHVSDRLSCSYLNDQQRQIFVTALVDQTTGQYQKNVEAVLGSGDYRTGFITHTNLRFDQYSKGKFDDNQPGYAARRLLGNEIQRIMGMSQTNKWLIQQVIDIDSLDAAEQLSKSALKLLDDTGEARDLIKKP